MYIGAAKPRNSSLSGYLGSIPSGVAGVKATLRLMRALTRQYKTDVELRDFAAKLVQSLPQKDYAGQAKKVFDFVRDSVRYLRDVNGVETLQTPLKTLELRYGDCDDKSTLLATLLESIGHPTRFVAIASQSPDVFNHVFLETLIGKKWVAADATEPHSFGWRPPRVLNQLVVHN